MAYFSESKYWIYLSVLDHDLQEPSCLFLKKDKSILKSQERLIEHLESKATVIVINHIHLVYFSLIASTVNLMSYFLNLDIPEQLQFFFCI